MKSILFYLKRAENVQDLLLPSVLTFAAFVVIFLFCEIGQQILDRSSEASLNFNQSECSLASQILRAHDRFYFRHVKKHIKEKVIQFYYTILKFFLFYGELKEFIIDLSVS